VDLFPWRSLMARGDGNTPNFKDAMRSSARKRIKTQTSKACKVSIAKATLRGSVNFAQFTVTAHHF